MPSSTLHKASEMAPEVRRAVETLLGRPLDSEEHVSLTAFRLGHAPTSKVRAKLSRQLEQRIDKTAGRVEAVPEHELDAAIDEAAHHVRHHPS